MRDRKPVTITYKTKVREKRDALRKVIEARDPGTPNNYVRVWLNT